MAIGVAIMMSVLQMSMAQAACGWRQPNGDISSSADGPIVLRAMGLKLVANKHWYEDRRFPIGSLMGTDEVSLRVAGSCTLLRELNGSKVDVVYVPPADAVPHGQGYRLQPHALGVAVDIEFPFGVPHPAGWLLTQSTLVVGAGGALPASAFSTPITLRITLVKTGAFSGKGQQSLLQMQGDLGWLRYYKAGSATAVAVSDNALQLPAGYGASGQGYVGKVLAPHCRLTYLGDLSLEQGPRSIRLMAVSQNDFNGPGAIDRAAVSQPLGFSCEGSDHLEPAVYLEATYPLGHGYEGVGLPERDSDVGVQVLLDDQPLRLGVRSAALGWNPQLLPSDLADGRGGFVSAQGAYCRGDCTADMAGPAWVSGGASQGDNRGREARLTFRYYQTGQTPPAPRSFTVPFTLTLDVQ